MECRAIKNREEADRFLEILCEVFELSVTRAAPVFFNEPSFDLSRKWVGFKDGEMVTILTSTPLVFDYQAQKRAMGIAGVATLVQHQGKGYASELMNCILEFGRNNGEPRALLFAKNPALYQSLGFKIIDEIVEGPIENQGEDELHDDMEIHDIEKCYEEFSSGKENWLVRDELRWNVWKWSVRCCQPAPGGYLCHEGMTIREAITSLSTPWPIGKGMNWIGLKSVTESLIIPTTPAPQGSYLMGIGLDFTPQMFLTDQF